MNPKALLNTAFWRRESYETSLGDASPEWLLLRNASRVLPLSPIPFMRHSRMASRKRASSSMDSFR